MLYIHLKGQLDRFLQTQPFISHLIPQEALRGDWDGDMGERPKLLKLNVIVIIIINNKVRQEMLLLVKFPPLLHTHTSRNLSPRVFLGRRH